MRAFIWDGTAPVSLNYHTHGSLLIVAETVEDARKAWIDNWASREVGRYDEVEPHEWPEATANEPDHSWPVEADPIILAFPDAGCC